MQKRKCGHSDLELFPLGLGCWEFGGGDYWGTSSQQDTDLIVAKAIDSGINYFDTAEVYNDGRSETSLGLALRPFQRDRVIVGSKIAPSNCYPGEITRHCEASLARLGTDYIDLYMLHWPVNAISLKHFTDDLPKIANPPGLEAVQAEFAQLRNSGKIRHFGVSNFSTERLAELTLQPAVNELPYNLLCRAIEFDCLDVCRQQNIGIISYMTLLQGVLGKTLTDIDTLPPQLKRTRHFDSRRNPLARHDGPGAEEALRETLSELHKEAARSHSLLPELAIRWAVSNSDICCALVGSRSPERLEANVRAAQHVLPADVVQCLNRITGPLKTELGPSLDYYESIENNRT